jgi:hypothetical protein
MPVIAKREWRIEASFEGFEASEAGDPFVVVELAEAFALGPTTISITKLRNGKWRRFYDIGEAVAELADRIRRVETFGDGHAPLLMGGARRRSKKDANRRACYERAMSNEHARPSAKSSDDAPEVRAPSHAERCRTLVAKSRSGALATITSGRGRGAATDAAMDRDPSGFPYASLVTVAFDPRGRPLMFLSDLAEHTQNLKAHAEASVLVTDPLDAHPEPLAASRLTLIGPCAKLTDEAERAAARETFLTKHASARYYIEFKDFAFYRLDPIALRYVGGFGRMSWVTCDDYAAAEPDPLVDAAAGILSHMNEDHADAVLAYATSLAKIDGATKATMTAVDRYGFEMTVIAGDAPRAVRLAFDEPVATSDEVRRAMVELVKRARAAS